MEKARADKIITEYMKKLYGFALPKTSSIDSAEELASRITEERLIHYTVEKISIYV